MPGDRDDRSSAVFELQDKERTYGASTRHLIPDSRTRFRPDVEAVWSTAPL